MPSTALDRWTDSDIIGGDNNYFMGSQAEFGDTCEEKECTIYAFPSSTRKTGQWLSYFNKKLLQAFLMTDDWDGMGSAGPNRRAYRNAKEVLFALYDKNIMPNNILPSSEEGIIISFQKQNSYSFIESYNNGTIAAAYAEPGLEPRLWEVENSQAGIKNFIASHEQYL